jgi:ABC-type lipoprotein export system ATPase subunit
VAIARALVNRPALLFADEPTGNLDSHTSEDVLGMFEKLNQEDGITIVLVTHDTDVARHARRIIRIRDGVIEDDASAAGLEPPPEHRRALTDLSAEHTETAGAK